MTSSKPFPSQLGIAVSTSVAAGGFDLANHAEGIVTSTAIKAGHIEPNHAESLALR